MTVKKNWLLEDCDIRGFFFFLSVCSSWERRRVGKRSGARSHFQDRQFKGTWLGVLGSYRFLQIDSVLHLVGLGLCIVSISKELY